MVYPSGSNFGGNMYSQCTQDIYGLSQDLTTQLYIHRLMTTGTGVKKYQPQRASSG